MFVWQILTYQNIFLLRWRGHTRMGPCIWGISLRLLGADVLSRYHRLKGDSVLFVSGSDCYGTPIALEAIAQGVSPASIAEKYHYGILRVV